VGYSPDIWRQWSELHGYRPHAVALIWHPLVYFLEEEGDTSCWMRNKCCCVAKWQHMLRCQLMLADCQDHTLKGCAVKCHSSTLCCIPQLELNRKYHNLVYRCNTVIYIYGVFIYSRQRNFCAFYAFFPWSAQNICKVERSCLSVCLSACFISQTTESGTGSLH